MPRLATKRGREKFEGSIGLVHRGETRRRKRGKEEHGLRENIVEGEKEVTVTNCIPGGAPFSQLNKGVRDAVSATTKEMFNINKLCKNVH